MKLSKFNKWVKDYPEKGECLLFNTRTQAFLKIDQELKKALDGLDNHGSREIEERLKENIEDLKGNGIIVEDDRDDEAKLYDFFRQIKYESDALTYEVTILTTYNCNFRCVYCFEESVKESVFLDKNTENLIVIF